MNVCWDFIHDLEGGTILEGYVPCDSNGDPLGHSGVTIAAGFDLGRRDADDLWDMGVSEDLVERLDPYCGLTGHEALDVLRNDPLTITEDEGRDINDVLHEAFYEDVADRWGDHSDVPFEELSEGEATVVMSVAWQYGSPWRRCPTFWGMATENDWDGVIAELRDFGDRYPTRRNREADFLEESYR